MINKNKYCTYVIVSLLALLLVNGAALAASAAAKQLAKGISLYNSNKDEKAMDYFIDVLVQGNEEEVAQANQYIDLIHNRMGGIQTPVEVDIDFKEGEVKTLGEGVDEAVQRAQAAEQAAAEQEARALQAAQQAVATAQGQQQQAVDAVDAQQKALTDWIEDQRMAAEEAAQQAQVKAAALAAPADAAAAEVVDGVLNEEVIEEDIPGVGEVVAEDLQARVGTEQTLPNIPQEPTIAQGAVLTSDASASSTFADLTSPEAIQARELYTNQKIGSMTQAAISKINDAKGVQLYMRDERPDALEIDPGVIFDKGNFRTDAQPLLNNIYELLALTQGALYVILPPGSYTDDVTLAGIRQAMALNSYLIKRGISQGKLHYNMGLVNEEPPARFANLQGLAIVFDYDAKLPTVMEKNENDEKAPLLSMAVVPLCHAIDRALGEAFAIDFSVLETVNPLDNWVLQVVQHGHDGKYYVVRQLEGFAPVYHQILWNGRKGIIGPELPCGKYTLVLTGTDLKGKKQTLRRRIIVKCSEQKKSCTTGSCAEKKTDKPLDYSAARLWTKPGRIMRTTTPTKTPTVSTQPVEEKDSATVKKTVTNTTIIEEDKGTDPLAASDSAISSINSADYESLPMNNPYDMPYEDLSN